MDDGVSSASDFGVVAGSDDQATLVGVAPEFGDDAIRPWPIQAGRRLVRNDRWSAGGQDSREDYALTFATFPGSFQLTLWRLAGGCFILTGLAVSWRTISDTAR